MEVGYGKTLGKYYQDYIDILYPILMQKNMLDDSDFYHH